MKKIVSLVALLSLLLLAGCQSYQLNDGFQPQFEDIALGPVVNQSPIPRAGPFLSRAIQEAITREPGMRVTSPVSAPVILKTTVIQLQTVATGWNPEDTAVTQRQHVRLVVQCSLLGLPSGQPVIPDFEIVAEGEAGTIDGSIRQLDAQLPWLAERAARKIVETLKARP